MIKLVGWFYTGSASLFAEAVHSFADTMNQLILAFGLHQSLNRPNNEHPYDLDLDLDRLELSFKAPIF